MSQFQARFDQFRSITDVGTDHRRAVKEKCKQGVEKLDVLARSMPDDKEELREDIAVWVERFDQAMGEWLAAQKQADELQIIMEPDAKDTEHIMSAEQVQAGWKEQIEKDKANTEQAKAKDAEDEVAGVKDRPMATQGSTVEVDEVEEVVAPTAERREASSNAVSVISSGFKDDEVTETQRKRPAPTPVTKETKDVLRPVERACDKCREAGEMCYEGPSAACKWCSVRKVGCSVAGGRSAPRKRGTVAVVVPAHPKRPLPVMRTAKGQQKIAAHWVVDSDWESEVEEKVVSEGGESEVEVVKASTSKAKGKERAKASVEKGKAKAPVKKTYDRHVPDRLRGPLTRRVNVVQARLTQICGAIRALEVEHEGLLVEVSENCRAARQLGPVE
ncbi:hypothetical protein OG21DRAFT_1489717 [Imleria badia]|nr:hypothetical protein OG21DRAFT_1489717 [Imleria badia]